MAGDKCPSIQDALGKANANRPEIEQIIIRNALGRSEDEFERDLYVIRRRIEKAASVSQTDVYVCSLSCRSVIYKGMFLAENLTDFIRIYSIRNLSRASPFTISVIRPTHSRPGSSPSPSAHCP